MSADADVKQVKSTPAKGQQLTPEELDRRQKIADYYADVPPTQGKNSTA